MVANARAIRAAGTSQGSNEAGRRVVSPTKQPCAPQKMSERQEEWLWKRTPPKPANV